MNKILAAWERKTTMEKITLVASIVCSVGVIALGIVYLMGAWSGAIHVILPLLAGLMLTQAAQNWKYNRGTAIFALCFAVVILIIAVARLLGV